MLYKLKAFFCRIDSRLLQHRLLYRILVLLLPVILALIIYLCTPLIIALGKALPSCLFNRATGLFCPGCGNTRSVVALLNGDILQSFRSNITPYVAFFLLCCLYAELVAHAFNKRLKTFVHSKKALAIIGALLLIWLIVRNFFPSLCPIDVNW